MPKPNFRHQPCVYRFFDDTGQLLYVGITENFQDRCYQHKSTVWWQQVEDFTIEYHPTREAARWAEDAAIATESPRHNLGGVPQHLRYRDPLYGNPNYAT